MKSPQHLRVLVNSYVYVYIPLSLSPPGLQKLIFFHRRGRVLDLGNSVCPFVCPSSLFGIGNLVLKVLVSSWGFINIEWYSATPSQVFVSGRTAIDQPGGWTGPRADTWSASWLLGRSSTFWQGRDNTDFRGADFKKKYVQSFYIDKTWFWLWIEMASTATPNVLVLVTFIYSANVWLQVLCNWRQRLLQASRQNTRDWTVSQESDVWLSGCWTFITFDDLDFFSP